MDKKDFDIRKKVINETFNDTRKIKCSFDIGELQLDEQIHQKGDFFKTEEDEIIDLEFQDTDFNEEELVKYVELAESIYEKHPKKISIYILCPKDLNVCVRECEIKSEADFTIKLACISETRPQLALNIIKQKLMKYGYLDAEDIAILTDLPMKCKKEERNYYLLEYFRIINRVIQ